MKAVENWNNDDREILKKQEEKKYELDWPFWIWNVVWNTVEKIFLKIKNLISKK